MLVKDALNFRRGHVFAAGQDHILGAIDNENVTFLIKGGQVARVKPTVAKGGGRGFRLTPVAFHHHVAAHHDFPHLLAVGRHVTPIEIDDANFAARQSVAGSGLAAQFLLRGVIREVLLNVSDADDGRRFRQAVTPMAVQLGIFFSTSCMRAVLAGAPPIMTSCTLLKS